MAKALTLDGDVIHQSETQRAPVMKWDRVSGSRDAWLAGKLRDQSQASAVKRSVLKTGRGPDWAMAGQHRSVKIHLAASDHTSGEKRDGRG